MMRLVFFLTYFNYIIEFIYIDYLYKSYNIINYNNII